MPSVRSLKPDTQMTTDFLTRVREAAAKRLLFLPHAVHQMGRPDRMITPREVRTVVLTGELIEDYPDDKRGHSGLLYGHGQEQRSIHAVCSPKDEYLAIITAYLPSEHAWRADRRTRRSK